MSEIPKPGSDEAVAQGCTCPILDNGHGRGRGGDGEQFGWWITEGCVLHGQLMETNPEPPVPPTTSP